MAGASVSWMRLSRRRWPVLSVVPRLVSSRSQIDMSSSTLATMRCCSAKGWKGKKRIADRRHLARQVAMPVACLIWGSFKLMNLANGVKCRARNSAGPCNDVSINRTLCRNRLLKICISLVAQNLRDPEAFPPKCTEIRISPPSANQVRPPLCWSEELQ